jgi:uncharacterized protein YkuJ
MLEGDRTNAPPDGGASLALLQLLSERNGGKLETAWFEQPGRVGCEVRFAVEGHSFSTRRLWAPDAESAQEAAAKELIRELRKMGFGAEPPRHVSEDERFDAFGEDPKAALLARCARRQLVPIVVVRTAREESRLRFEARVRLELPGNRLFWGDAVVADDAVRAERGACAAFLSKFERRLPMATRPRDSTDR